MAYTQHGAYATYPDGRKYRVLGNGGHEEIPLTGINVRPISVICGLKIASDPEASEAMRQKHVPHYYDACAFRTVLAKPYDHLTEETPLFVECRHPEFDIETAECLGQCALAGRIYGYEVKKNAIH